MSFVKGLTGSTLAGICPIWRHSSMRMEVRNSYPLKASHTRTLWRKFHVMWRRFKSSRYACWSQATVWSEIFWEEQFWEKTFCHSFSEFYDEFSNQLVLSHLRTIRGSRTAELDDGILRLLSECYYPMNSDRRIHAIEVMNRIEQLELSVEFNLTKGFKRMKMVEVTHKGRTTSWMVNKAMPFLKEFNLRVTEWRTVPPLLDIWIYYRALNKNIIMEFGIMYLPGYLLLPLGSNSPIFGIPRIQKYIEGPSCGILREVVPQVISVPCDPCSIENDLAQDAI